MRQPAPRVEPPAPRVQTPPPRVLPPALPRVQLPVEQNTHPVAAQTRPRQLKPTTSQDEPVAHHNQSQNIEEYLTINPAQAYQRKYPRKLMDLWCTPLTPDLAAVPVLRKETGKTLEFRQLRTHPKYKETWNISYCNELVRLCQGMGHGIGGPQQQRVKGTNTFRITRSEEIPVHKRGDICHTRVVYEVRPGKDNPKRTRINVNGGDIHYDGDVETPTGSLNLVKLMINSVLSRPRARFACFDVKTFTLTRL